MKYFCNISRKNFVTKLIFGMLINITVFLKLILSLLMGLANHAQSTQASLHYICDISKQKLGTEFIFCRQVNIRVFIDVQSSQNNQFPLSLKCHARVSRFLVCTQTAQPYPKYLQCHTQSIYNDKCNISRTGCQIVITSYIQIDLTSFELVPLVGMLMYVQICPMYYSSIYTIELQQFHHTLNIHMQYLATHAQYVGQCQFSSHTQVSALILFSALTWLVSNSRAIFFYSY